MHISIAEHILAASDDSLNSLKQHAASKFQQLQGSAEKTHETMAEELRQQAEKIQSLEDERAQMRRGMQALQERLEAAERALSTSGLPPGLPMVPGLPLPQEVAAPPPGLASLGPGHAARAALATSLGLPSLPTFPLMSPSTAPTAWTGNPDSADSAAAEATAAVAAAEPKTPPGLKPAAPPGLKPAASRPLAAAAHAAGEGPEELPPGLRSPEPKRSTLGQPPRTPQPAGTPQRARNTTPGPASRTLTCPRTPPRTPPQRTPKASCGTPYGLKSPAVPASPFVHCEDGSSVFGFLLRIAPGVPVGLEFAITDSIPALRVVGIVPGGAIEAWNRQCLGGPSAGKALTPGDKVVQVNNAIDTQGMLAEFKEKNMLRITVARGDPDVDFTTVWSSAAAQPRGMRTRHSLGSSASTPTVQDSASLSDLLGSPSPKPSPKLNPVAAEFVPASICPIPA